MTDPDTEAQPEQRAAQAAEYPADEHVHVPLDIFDPSSDGFPPYDLDSVVAAARQLRSALKALEEALTGCKTPLNLTKELEALRSTYQELNPWLANITRARNIVEGDVPIARQFRYGEQPWAEGRGDGRVALSPSQLKLLAELAKTAMPSESTTYREHVLSTLPVPSVIQRARSAAAKAEQRHERSLLIEQILDDVKKYPCEFCKAEAGNYCQTASGRIGGPHVGRIRLAPLAAAHPRLKGELKWEDLDASQRWLDERRDLEDRRLEEKHLLDEAIAMIAETTMPKYD